MAVLFRVKAIYEYESPHDDDLNFPAGQVIAVTEEEDDDWYGGEYVDTSGVKHEGIFPRNFVEKFEPVAPPRPTRTRTKKETEAPQPSVTEEVTSAPSPPPRDEPAAVEEEDEDDEGEELQEAEAPQPEEQPAPVQENVPRAVPPPPGPVTAVATATDSVEHASNTADPPTFPKPKEPPAPAASAPVPAPKAKPGPPPVAEKPSSFKDRIAAFNKTNERPIAPFKPGGLTGSKDFIKKPFVAPPPSRDAYVAPRRDPPPLKEYRREEDPEIKEREEEAQEQAEKAGLVPPEAKQEDAAEGEDQPKPTSLKERIALLQKQQMEQAQRHADAAAKKEKPKRPPKKRLASNAPADAEEEEPIPEQTVAEPQEAEEANERASMEEEPAARAPPPRRKSSKGPAVETIRDGNEADMSGAGDTTEGQEDEREDSDDTPRRMSRTPTVPVPIPAQMPVARNDRLEAPARQEEASDDEIAEEEEEGDEDDVDPEVKRKEELRARMAKMSGGMGFHGMFGAPPIPSAQTKKKKPKAEPAPAVEEGEEEEEEEPHGRTAPPIPTPMAINPLSGVPGQKKDKELSREESDPVPKAVPPPVPSRQPTGQLGESESEEDEGDVATPAAYGKPLASPRSLSGQPPPIPGSRPAPPPVPAESRPPPPLPPVNIQSQTEGSQSDDELSAGAREAERISTSRPVAPAAPQPSQAADLPTRSPPLSPRPDDSSATSPTVPSNKRNSRPPPPIPGSAPLAPPAVNRPPPPPPPSALSRQSTIESHVPLSSKVPQAGEEDGEEVTEYEGDYDTDIGSSVPHKDALKAHARDSSLEDNALQSPTGEAPKDVPPPVPTSSAPRAVPPPVPIQAAPDNKRQSMNAPRAAPPPPPPAKEPIGPEDEEYDNYNQGLPTPLGHTGNNPGKAIRAEPDTYFQGANSPSERRAPPTTPGGRVASRTSMDGARTSTSNRRSVDMLRPSIESGFIANDIDLAVQSGWWKQANQVPPVLQGRRDIFYECEESNSTNQGVKTITTRNIAVLFQDYSQTVLTVQYDPYNLSDVNVDQQHEPPPRSLRQDEMEEFYDRFGRRIAEAAIAKKDTVVGEGTPQSLVMELLRPLKDALWPVGMRSYGALVYSNMANASTQQHDEIRAGDIISIRNAKFQGKHGAMHAKYSADVGKPDHVGIVAEWDGTKKKVRVWEQGRESKKVKVESFKLDDLRSGEVKIWRVVPRSWVGWNSQP